MLYTVCTTTVIKLIWSLFLFAFLSVLIIAFISISIWLIKQYPYIDKIDNWAKNNQKLMIYIPVLIVMINIFMWIISIISTDALIALVTSITFIFTIMNVYISNYWNEITTHRNTTLVNPPHLQYQKDKDEKNNSENKCVYRNEGGSAAKYVKLYEFGLETKIKNVDVNTDENSYETIKLAKKKYAYSEINKLLDRSVMPSAEWMPYEIATELIDGKKTKGTQCSNAIIHTDFSQRNIFITYTYFLIIGGDAKPKVKRFTPLSYDFTYDCLINNEEMLESLKKFLNDNYRVIGKMENDSENSEKEEFVKLQTDFINFVISDYLERMRS